MYVSHVYFIVKREIIKNFKKENYLFFWIFYVLLMFLFKRKYEKSKTKKKEKKNWYDLSQPIEATEEFVESSNEFLSWKNQRQGSEADDVSKQDAVRERKVWLMAEKHLKKQSVNTTLADIITIYITC